MIKYNPEISLGSIAETATIILAIVGISISVSNKLAIHEEKLQQHDKSIAAIEKGSYEFRSELKSDIKDIGRDVKELDNKLTRAMVYDASRNKPR